METGQPETRMSVGSLLRQLRESRGLSLEEIARLTRVSTSYLQALEADDFASLPAAVFTRGFIRAYCQALAEPPEAALALFDGRLEPEPATAAGVGSPPPRASSPRRVTPRSTAAGRLSGESGSKSRGPVLISFILLVVLGIALFAVTLALQSGRETGSERGAAVIMPPARGAETPGGSFAQGGGAPPPAAAVAAGAPSEGATPAARPAGYRLVARTVEPTWMRVKTDDGRTTEETIPAGQVREWFSPGPFTLTVGNAGGVNLEVNGRALPSLGPSGVVIPRLVVPTELQ